MKLPFILLVDDDEQVLRSLQRDIRNQYRENYKILASESASEMLDLVRELKLKNDSVALVISDQRMPEMEGIQFLEKVKEIFPESKQMLLTAYSDMEVAIKGINELRLNYFLLKPWNPPEEKLFPVINELLDDWNAGFRPDHEGIRLVGHQWSPKSHQIKEFLFGNLVPYQWIDFESNEKALPIMESAQAEISDLPLVILSDGTLLKNPTIADLGLKVGLKQTPQNPIYDLAIIGAGPAGLAASVYGSSEGLRTILIEAKNPGGQAGSSARIENYLGFPSGLSGAELSRRPISQTRKFGTEILTPKQVRKIRLVDQYKIIELDGGDEIKTRAIVIATGVAYRKLETPGLDKLTGAGVYYGAAAVESHGCRNKPIYIVGGGNSTCQAALQMCNIASEVHLIIRQNELKNAAADYLVQNISKIPNIFIHGNSEVIGVSGNEILESIRIKNMKSGEERTENTNFLFIYIGAKPSTDWLGDVAIRDNKGFIVTGSDLKNEKSYRIHWKLEREPFPTETIVPGIFASGDVRYGALYGISSAVGEGAMSVRFARKYLQEN